jgi:formylglycine-generating enzyme required for sulfatase activity
LLGPALDLGAHEQLLIIDQDTQPSRAIKNTLGQRGVWLSAGDWPALVAAMKFTGQRKLIEVWPKARILAGNPEPIALKGLCQPQEYIDEQGMAFVRLCPDTFLMGSPENEPDRDNDEIEHRVTLSTFDIGKYEVINAQYQKFKPDHSEHDDRPVVKVSWDEAKAFCEHYGYRLPTEAEWEYAARAGTQTRWSFGNDKSQLERYAWYSKNSNYEAHPIDTREPNPWGLYDMHGNVWEWVADWYGDYTGGAQTDPTGPDQGEHRRVLRGGAFGGGPGELRSANRFGVWPGDRYVGVGFRCARAPRRQP